MMILLPGKYNVSDDYRINRGYDPWVVTRIDYTNDGTVNLAVDSPSDNFSSNYFISSVLRWAKTEGWEYAGLP